jgi:hypothetical protein
MPESGSGGGPFIRAELRPSAGEEAPPVPIVEAELSEEELQRRALEVMEEAGYAPLGGDRLPPELWQTRFARSQRVTWRVVEGEAILLSLENFRYYSLNRVGTAVWEQLTGEAPLAAIPARLCEQFEVSEAAARADLAALITQLRQEQLVVEAT